MSIIALHGRRIAEESVVHVKEILEVIKAHGRDIAVSPDLEILFLDRGLSPTWQVYDPHDDMRKYEAVFSLGGDGTLLDTLTHVACSQVPILGINLGRLGFLAMISKENITAALQNYFTGKFEVEHRSVIEVNTDNQIFGEKNFALNEFAILRKDTSSMIVVRSTLNGEFLNTYWADGLMVATPTGSTGYSLSCGGPVVTPDTKNFIITPISPHNLNVRPLIIDDESELCLTVSSDRQSCQASLDSRSVSVSEKVEFRVRKARFTANLVKVEGATFLDTLRSKLSWGLDKRN